MRSGRGSGVYITLLAVMLVVLLLGVGDAVCEENSDTGQAVRKKSVDIAFAGALVSPVIGHAYIGGENTLRGILYTASELFLGVAFLGSALSRLGGYTADNAHPEGFLYWAAATHIISLADAVISVQKINSNSPTKSYVIATGGSAVFPVIGLGYVGGKWTGLRAGLYTVAQFIAFTETRPVTARREITRGIRYVSMADAFISTARYNRSVTKVSIIPDGSSVRLVVMRTF